MKDYQKMQTNLIDMLEDLEELEKSLDEILSLSDEDNSIDNDFCDEKEEDEVEMITPIFNPRFNITSGKINPK